MHLRKHRIRTGCFSLIVLAAGACDPHVFTPREDMTAHFSAGFWSEWSDPVNVTAVNSPFIEQQPILSPDGLALYFSSGRPGGVGNNDLWVSRRATRDSPWSAPVNLGAVINSTERDNAPNLSNNGHLLFFQSDRPGGHGAVDIYVSWRSDTKDDFAWQAPVNLGPDVNTAVYEAGPFYLQNLEEGRMNFYFTRGLGTTDQDIYAAAVRFDGTTLGPAVPVTELSSAIADDAQPAVRQDGREIVFQSDRSGGMGREDLYFATRANIHDEWSVPMNLGAPVNTVARDFQPFLSLDGQTLLFVSNRPGSIGFSDIYVSTRSRLAR